MAGTELAPGRTVAGDRYLLERLLGAGGMATVWLARDQRLGRLVAVKLLSDVLALDRSYVERFGREARIAAQLRHPNLVQVYDYDADSERPLIAMELVDGPTLADVLRSRAAAASVDSRRLAGELLAALGHIHAAGVVHRDVKPANVLIGADGSARLTDFGIAQPHDASRLTVTGGLVGTLGYLAPEVLEGARATPRSDLYSAGVLLGAVTDAQQQHGRADRSLASLIAALTQPAPERRPPSAHAALGQLAAQPASTPARVRVARAPAASRRASTALTLRSPRGLGAPAPRALADALLRDLRRRPAAMALAGVAAGVLVVVIVALAASGSGAGTRAPSSSPARAGSQRPPPASAPLAEQLRAIERSLSSLPRR